ncbi:MAG: tryptophan--tRNA ligase [Alphaproteobacteria bacterium]|nr:tryptophan--tRNA ligase [Alphaproteobacteria bacterium]
MKRILSGMQPTNNLHLGNYLGALQNWVKLQDEPEASCLYMVADLHAITLPQEPDALRKATREIAAAYIAGGLDPDKSTIFVQSSVPGHSELMWLLSTFAQMGKLERMTQFKDKAGKNAERAGLGLFAYPVLMAADILIYKATHVPVGDDQKQHLELARDVAATFNTKYAQEHFLLPEPYIMGEATRIMSLKDGTKKMSKSDESDLSRINMTDDADTIARKIKKAQTDPENLPETVAALAGRPGALNLVTIYAALAGCDRANVLAQYAGMGWGAFKPALADLAVAKLSPITARMNELLGDVAEIDRILKAGSEVAGALAERTVQETRDIMGFWKM